MNLSQVINKFNNSAYSHRWVPTSLGNKRVQKILELIGSGKKVLDVGCYDGTISKQIINRGNQVIGIDLAQTAVIMAKKNGISAFRCNLEEENIPKSLGKFDAIVAGEIIEHIFDTDGFIRKLGQSLRSGGFLILTTPNLAGLGSRISLLFGNVPWMIENSIEGIKSGHIRYFNFFELSQLLTRNGFKVVSLYADSVGFGDFSLPWIEKIVPRLGRILVVKAVKL